MLIVGLKKKFVIYKKRLHASRENRTAKKNDSAKGLNGKNKILTITSMILLAVQLIGATIAEANTFSWCRMPGFNLLSAC
jgi:hypothetical protein